MFDDTIKKYTANKRTGANLTSIRLGATPNLTNNIAVATIKELEEFGKRIDKSRIDRETQRLYIEGKKRDLEFERTLSDPQIYLNDELYDKKVKELEELKKAKNMDIASSKYLDIETKRSLMQSLEVENEKILNDMTAKRTVNLFKREVSALNNEMEQLIIIGGDLPAYDIEGKKKIVGKLQNSNQRYRELTGLSAMEGAMILGQGIMNMEQRGLDNLLTDIINSNLDTSVKKEKIEGILTEINDEKKLDQLASNYNTYLPKGLSKENQEQMKLFYKATIKNVYREVGERANKELDRIIYNKEVERAKREREQKKINNIENQIRSYIIKRDTQKLTQLTTGKVYTTSEMVSDNKNLNNLYGKTILEFGDITNSAVPKIMNNGDKSELKDLIKRAKEDGLTEQNIANSVIYPYLNQLAGNDEYKLNALIKDFGTEGIKGFDVDTLLNGRKDPEYFNVSKKLNAGRGYELPDEDIDKIGNFYNNSRERYKALINSLGGDRKAKQAVDAYIKGAILNSTDEELSVYAEEVKKEVKEIMPDVFKIFLIDNDNYNEMRNNLERIRKREISPTLYKESNILMENFGIKELTFVDVPLETDDNFEVIGD